MKQENGYIDRVGRIIDFLLVVTSRILQKLQELYKTFELINKDFFKTKIRKT